MGKAVLLAPFVVLAVLVVAEALPFWAVLLSPIVLFPAARYSARWDEEELARLPTVPLRGWNGDPDAAVPEPQPGEVTPYRSLASSLVECAVPLVFVAAFTILLVGSQGRSGWIGGVPLVAGGVWYLRRCLGSSVELRWDEVVVRNPLRTHRLRWSEIERVGHAGDGVDFWRRESRGIVTAVATKLLLRREFVRDLRRFAAIHDHISVDEELEKRRS